MDAQFAKWGNSVALRIPAAFAKELGITDGKAAQITVKDGSLVVTPMAGPVYTLDGKDLGATPGLTHEDHPTGLVGTNAVAGLAATNHATEKKFTEALWNAPIPSGQNRYYDGMLYMMSLMHASGEFRIWGPR